MQGPPSSRIRYNAGLELKERSRKLKKAAAGSRDRNCGRVLHNPRGLRSKEETPQNSKPKPKTRRKRAHNAGDPAPGAAPAAGAEPPAGPQPSAEPRRDHPAGPEPPAEPQGEGAEKKERSKVYTKGPHMGEKYARKNRPRFDRRGYNDSVDISMIAGATTIT